MLVRGLHHQSGFVRKGSAFLLQVAKPLARWRSTELNYKTTPPVFANSFPKSGTHLLDQIVECLPAMRNFGEFLSSMTSSFQFRERTEASTLAFINATVAGELVRSHMFHAPAYADAIAEKNIVHYFIYRDPRDLCISEANYLRNMNRWHRMSPYFRAAASMDDAITLAISGLANAHAKISYPNIAERFRKYQGWINSENVFAVKYEDLMSDHRDELLKQMIRFYRARSEVPFEEQEVFKRVQASINPERSHTYRKASKRGWRNLLNEEHRRLIKEQAGSLLIDLGYESDYQW